MMNYSHEGLTMNNTTEKESHYNDLEKMTIDELLININKEDHTVADAVSKEIPEISKLVEATLERMHRGGRLFYIGAGTSGRLGVLDASEIPPTFGVPHDWVIALIAGGDSAIRKAVEFAEDDMEQAWKDLSQYNLTNKDTLIGIAASGTTPYVLGGIRAANQAGLLTGCVVCNSGSVLAQEVGYPVEVVVGPEFVTGSTRMKAGTAQKMVLNMITTSIMIQLGRVKGNKMVDMQLSNIKLVNRGIRFIMEETHLDEEAASKLLEQYGSVREAIAHSGK